VTTARVSLSDLQRPRARARGRGFTLVEVLVAVAILAILAAIIAPRFGTVRRGEGVLAGDQLEDLVRMWAFRASMGTQQVGIWRSPETGYIFLSVREGDPNDPEAAPIWNEDRTTMPVRLPESVEVIDVQIDGESQPLDSWFVRTNPDRTRPRFSITYRDSSNRETTIAIEPYSIAPIRTDPDRSIAIRQPVDLDREGLERSPW
jgi:prepilin-type N-terminal cleavage/methylation domain-containing protein